MSQYVDGNIKNFTAGAAIAQHLRVKLSAGVLAAAGAADVEIGTITDASFASGDIRGVRLRSASGTGKMVAAAAITAGVIVYGAAGGKISATAGGVPLGIALEAASADNDVIEVLRDTDILPRAAAVAAAGSAQGDAAALTGVLNIVSGADGTKGVILPTCAEGLQYFVYNSVATNGLKIYPATGGDINDGTANAAITIEGKTLAIFIGTDATTWACSFTVNT